MKTSKRVDNNEHNKEVIHYLFNEYFQQRIDEENREKQTLIDKFKLHLKGKVIILENSK